MGQLLSRQATPSRSQSRGTQPAPQRQRTLREWGFITEVDSGPRTSKSRQRDDRTSSRVQNTPTVRASKTRSQPFRKTGGDLGSLRRQQRYERGKIVPDRERSKEYQHHRLRKADTQPHHPNVTAKTHQKTRSQNSKSNSHHPKVRQTKDCIICTDTRSLSHFPSRLPTSQCTHDASVCRRCLRTWIKSEFNTKIWNEINCPICSARMRYDDIHAFAPREVFRRYDKLTTKAAYESIPNFRWCITRGCQSGQVHLPGTAKFRCKACRKAHCVTHGFAWHKGETCREYDYRTDKQLKKQEEAASKKIIAETTKQCPGCKRNIEKNYGCDHMTCSKCRHQFCWQCLAPYTKKVIRPVVHRPGCEYYGPGWDPA